MAARWRDGPARRLDRLLEAANLKSVDLARALGMDPSMISKYRSGERVPRADDLAEMIERARGSADEVLGLRSQQLDPVLAKEIVAFSERVIASKRGERK